LQLQAPNRESVFFVAARLLSFLPEAKSGLADDEKSARNEVREKNQLLPTADVCRRLKLYLFCSLIRFSVNRGGLG
jgi:hypothetical protein